MILGKVHFVGLCCIITMFNFQMKQFHHNICHIYLNATKGLFLKLGASISEVILNLCMKGRTDLHQTGQL